MVIFYSNSKHGMIRGKFHLSSNKGFDNIVGDAAKFPYTSIITQI